MTTVGVKGLNHVVYVPADNWLDVAVTELSGSADNSQSSAANSSSSSLPTATAQLGDPRTDAHNIACFAYFLS